jgi:hypothetical protein
MSLCKQCGVDHSLERAKERKAVSTGENVPKGTTQKARGLAALACRGLAMQFVVRPGEVKWNGGWPAFARPCPVRPRHGFVESRVVDNEDEVARVLEETRAVDPQGEVIVMPFVEAKGNAVLAGRKVVVGDGNDGATAGRSGWALALAEPATFEQDLLEEAGITGTAYVEAVSDVFDNVTLTQLRDGPTPPEADEYVPQTVVVQRVIVGKGDLVEFEREVEQAGEGAVIWLPGGSLLSHYAVHGVAKGIAVVTRARAPAVGDVLTPPKGQHVLSLQRFRQGVRVGMVVPLELGSARRAGKAALVGLHNAAASDGWSLGVSAAVLFRMGVTLCAGEARFVRKRQRNRSAIYQRTLSAKARLSQTLVASHKVFSTWVGGSSFGGAKWREAAEFVAELGAQLAKGSPGETVVALNKLVNHAHNGGWLFDKFFDRSYMNRAAANEFVMVVKAAFTFWGWSGVQAVARLPRAPQLVREYVGRQHEPPFVMTYAQVRLLDENTWRIQWEGNRGGGQAGGERDVPVKVEARGVLEALPPPSAKSKAQTEMLYWPAQVEGNKVLLQGVVLWEKE